MKEIQQILEEIQAYDANKEAQTYFLIHKVRYEFILNRIQNIARGNKLTILDIGCYPYHIGFALEQLGHRVYGISSFHEPVKRKNVSVLNIETDHFPFKAKMFDLVLFNEVIEHLPQSPIPVLKEIHRVTKPGGHLMVTTPNITRSINRVKMLFGKSIMYSSDVYFEDDGKGNNIYHRHNREYTLSELVKLLEKTNWDIAQKNYFISYTPTRKRAIPDQLIIKLVKYLNFFLMSSIPEIRDTLYILGRKG